jgi:hypothetical protein
MVKVHCATCLRELHQAPAFISGPPNISGRVRQHPICRNCFRLLLELLRARVAVNQHDETPPNRLSNPAR